MVHIEHVGVHVACFSFLEELWGPWGDAEIDLEVSRCDRREFPSLSFAHETNNQTERYLALASRNDSTSQTADHPHLA